MARMQKRDKDRHNDRAAIFAGKLQRGLKKLVIVNEVIDAMVANEHRHARIEKRGDHKRDNPQRDKDNRAPSCPLSLGERAGMRGG